MSGIYRLTLTEADRDKLKSWLRSVLQADRDMDGDDRTLCEGTHAICCTDADAIELPRGQMDRLQVLLDAWALSEKRPELKREVGKFCGHVAGLLFKPPHRVTDDVPEVVAAPVADRQRSLFE